MRQSCRIAISVLGVILPLWPGGTLRAQEQKQPPPVQLGDEKEKREPVIPKELATQLARLGYPQNRYGLETFELLAEDGPADAFQKVRCYRLIDKEYTPTRDAITRHWQPVLVVGKEVQVGASEKMFARLLEASQYFKRPDQFKQDLVFQLHSFSMDFYKGYTLREQKLEIQKDLLIIRGTTPVGGPWEGRGIPFTTTAKKRGGVIFKLDEANHAQ